MYTVRKLGGGIRNKAFTLIELIGVVVILGILMLLVFPSIMNSIKKTENGLNEAGEKLLFSSASLYIDSNQMNYPLEEGNRYCIRVSDLLESKKLESVNLIKGLKETDRIEVNVINKEYTYQFNNNCSMYLKDRIEQDSPHIVMNTKVNGETVNKVIGSKSEKLSMTNYVWYAGQLWQVLETNDTSHTIKLVTAHGLTSIAYGETSHYNTSWIKKWLNEIFLASLEGTELITNTNFCLDKIDAIIEKDSTNESILSTNNHTKIETCTNKITEKVGLITFEDYIYSNNGTSAIYTGESYLDEDEFTWTMTAYDDTHIWVEWYTNKAPLKVQLGTEYSYVKKYGHGVRPVISITDNALIKSGEGTKANPYVLTIEKTAGKDSMIASAKVGDYIYIDESNNPYAFTEEYVARDLKYQTTKDKVRYRIIKKNDDGSIKIQRSDVLRNLPSTIARDYSMFIPIYYKEASDGCYYNQSEAKWYKTGCTNNNIFKIEGNTSEYSYQNSINIGDFLNSTSNSFYSWYSESTKAMIKLETYQRYTGGIGKDFSNLNDKPTETYPYITNDGDIEAHVVLPTWGEMYTGNDINTSYWFINRYPDASTYVITLYINGNIGGHEAADLGYAIRPVVTLKSNTIIKDGKGTMTEPYHLTLEA